MPTALLVASSANRVNEPPSSLGAWRGSKIGGSVSEGKTGGRKLSSLGENENARIRRSRLSD